MGKFEKINNFLRSITEFFIILFLFTALFSFVLELWSLGFVCLTGLVFLCFVYLSDLLSIIRENSLFFKLVFDEYAKSYAVQKEAQHE